MTNRATTICVLEILSEYSDANHILPMRNIIGKLKSIYDLEADRRTIYSAIDLLRQLGYDVSDYSENGVGYYLRQRDFESSEIHLLMDAVYSYQAISQQQTQKLIKKLQGLLSVHERRQYKSLSIVKAERKTPNQEVFLNIEVLDEAIQKWRMVQFTYLSYGFDKKLHPRRKEDYTASPYRLICTNERYYLLCRMVHRENLSMYRVDFMRDIRLTDTPSENQPKEQELLIAENRTTYAWYGVPELVELRCKNGQLRDVIDRFGTAIDLVPEPDGTFIAKFHAAPQGIKYWALQYLPYVEVLKPVWLRDEIIKSIQRNPYYDMK